MASDTIQPLIEGSLPKQFLYELGIYLQTCAHIELAACDFICRSEGLALRSDEWLKRFGGLRKTRLSDLLPILRRSGNSLPDPLAEEFDEFVNWIDQYKLNRHIAAHGAFFPTSKDGILRVHYTHKRMVGGQAIFIEEETDISRNLVIQLINDADRILRILTGIVFEIEKGSIVVKNNRA